MSKKQLVLSLIIALSLFSICIIKVVQGQTETTLIVEVYDINGNEPLRDVDINVLWSFTDGAYHQSDHKTTNAAGIATFSAFGDYEGTVSVSHHQDTGGGWSGAQQTIEIQKGQTYTVKFFLKKEGYAGPLNPFNPQNTRDVLVLIGLVVALGAIAILLARRKKAI